MHFDDRSALSDRYVPLRDIRGLEQHESVEVYHSTFSRKSCMSRTAILVGIVITIIGALALAGVHDPNCGLGALGQAIGEKGSIAMLVSPASLAIFLSIYGCYHRKQVEIEYVQVDPVEEYEVDNEGPFFFNLGR
jgi:hypothetical protein